MVLEYAVEENSESTYIRLVSIPCEVPYSLPSNYALRKGEGVALTEGDDVIVFSYGPVMLPQAFMAAEKLREEHGMGIKVVNLPWLNAVDHRWLKEVIGDIKYVLTLDNHLLSGGQGEKIGAVITQMGLSGLNFKMLGLTEVPVCGRNDEVLAHYGLNADGIINSILDIQK